jgi:hypothetical protein
MKKIIMKKFWILSVSAFISNHLTISAYAQYNEKSGAPNDYSAWIEDDSMGSKNDEQFVAKEVSRDQGISEEEMRELNANRAFHARQFNFRNHLRYPEEEVEIEEELPEAHSKAVFIDPQFINNSYYDNNGYRNLGESIQLDPYHSENYLTKQEPFSDINSIKESSIFSVEEENQNFPNFSDTNQINQWILGINPSY